MKVKFLDGSEKEVVIQAGAYLRGAYLMGAYLRGAYLMGAYLMGADLGNADLKGADLKGAYLRGANLTEAKLPHFQICPEKGCFRAFKKVADGSVLEIEIADTVGQEVEVTDFDGDIRIECTRGIHFYMTVAEVEEV